jgi:hypothetical protein
METASGDPYLFTGGSMAVRTNQAGIKRKRAVSPSAAQPNQQPSKGRKTRPRDEEAAYAREEKRSKMKLGPAAVKGQPKTGRSRTHVQGRKKAPSQMNLQRKGGPFKHTRLHGG